MNSKVNTGLNETILDRLSGSKKLFERGIDSKTEEQIYQEKLERKQTANLMREAGEQLRENHDEKVKDIEKCFN